MIDSSFNKKFFSVIKPYLQILISVLLIMISFPPYSISFSVFWGLGLFFHVLYKSKSIKKSVLYGLIFGLFFAASIGRGIIYASVVHYGKSPLFAFLFFILSAAVPSGILFGCFSLFFETLKNSGVTFRLLTLPALWTIFEYIREIIPGSIPWANMGYAMTSCISYIQFADISGVYGVSFIVAATSSVGLVLFETDPQPFKDKGYLNNKINICLILLLIISLPILYGYFQIRFIERTISSGQSLFSACIQGSHSPSDRWRGLEFFGRLKTYESMTKEVLIDKNGPAIIVWPESVLNIPGSASDTVFDDISQLIGKDSVLVAGGTRKGKEGLFNSAYVFSGKGSVSAYDKNILLPFAEKAVSSFKLGSFQEAPSEFVEGKTKAFVNEEGLNFGLSICLEDLYPWYVRKSVNQGAELLINISADDWFGNTGTAEMHLDAARMRAIENRRFMIRCANSGISAIISATGKLENRSSLFKQESIKGRAKLLKHKSLYSKSGDWVIMASAVIIALSFFRIIFDKEYSAHGHN